MMDTHFITCSFVVDGCTCALESIQSAVFISVGCFVDSGVVEGIRMGKNKGGAKGKAADDTSGWGFVVSR